MAVRVQRTREDRGRDESLRLIQCLVIIRDFTAMNICFLISVIMEMTARGRDKTSTSGISFLKLRSQTSSAASSSKPQLLNLNNEKLR